MRRNLQESLENINFEIVIDASINDQAKLSREDFSDRIHNVQGIRTREHWVYFYLTEHSKFRQLEMLHRIVNTGKFSGHEFTRNKLFAIGVPRNLFLWLKNITPETMYKQLLSWHAAFYALNSFQKFADEEFDPLVYKEVKKLVEKYYPGEYSSKFNLDNLESIRKYEAVKQKGLAYYYSVCEKYTGALPPEFLKNPYWDPINVIEENNRDWGLLPNCKFTILISYFNELDWIRIVERSAKKLKTFYKSSIASGQMTNKEIEDMIERADEDKLDRAESDPEMWLKWKHTFENYELRKEYTYSLLPRDNARSGFVYLLQDERTAVKIGWTKNEGSGRLMQNQTGSSTVLKEIGRFKASSVKTETVLHEMFRNKRVRDNGEWFWLTAEDIENILDEDWRMRNNVF